MRKKLLFTFAAATIATTTQAQFSEFTDNPSAFTLSSDKNTLQIGGRISFFYENRFLKSGQTNLKHNGFDIKDLDLDLKGTTASKFDYELHMSLVDIVTAAATLNASAPDNPGLKAAYLQYNGFKVKIKFGFDKVPFSQSNLTHEHETPNWSHPVLTGGDLFSRRDLGITLHTRLLNDKINLFAGAYTGMGENFFEYGNDASGTFEYVARAEFSYPGKIKYNLVDEENSPVVKFRIAANARYEDKTQPAGGNVVTTYADEPGAYGLRMINGRRTVYGGDAIVMYRGLSATFESDILYLQPASATDALYNGTTAAVNKNKINAGGFLTGMYYNWEKLHSVFSVNYENTNTNDLAAGNQEWVYYGYAYKINGFNSTAKVEYYMPVKEDAIANPLKYNGRIRVGYQIVF